LSPLPWVTIKARQWQEEMKEFRAELAEIKANNRVMNEKPDRLTEAVIAPR